MLCADISQACAGFVLGLIQSFMYLEQESIRKVVFVNGDVLSRKTLPRIVTFTPWLATPSPFR